MNYPKILIVSRLNWDDMSVSNTLTNMFGGYDPNKIARIYIETMQPNTKCCKLFYQISEISLINKLFKWSTSTGRVIRTDGAINVASSNPSFDGSAKQEASVMNFVRTHRSFLFSVLREILWYFNGWKSKELEEFIADFNPDVVWLDGSPLILMNRLNKFVYKTAQKPAVTFLMDDVYCYESCSSWLDRLFKYFLRKHVKWTVNHSEHVFVSSLKMKEEYDSIFGINSTFITKGVCSEQLKTNVETIHKPIRMVYLGNLLIGRLDSLVLIAECMKQINCDGEKLQLSVYTNSVVSESDKRRLLCDNSVKLYPPVSYDKVPDVIAENDVQVFTESMNGKHMSVARLSFSTKIIDYIQSGKCILAIGSHDVAPIEYFKNEDAALVATNKAELLQALLRLTDEQVIREYANKAIECGKRNHDIVKMRQTIYSVIQNVAVL